jgi:hypothetical protein
MFFPGLKVSKGMIPRISLLDIKKYYHILIIPRKSLSREKLIEVPESFVAKIR